MTGWDESELINAVAPFPYWPDEDRDMLTITVGRRAQRQEYLGRLTSSRQSAKMGRSLMHDCMSPHLIDAMGQQTGWMTSMTDITEPNRVRDQLASSYERFTIVLEALDASVSVAPLGSSELLFANKLYRQWFATDTEGPLKFGRKSRHAGVYAALNTKWTMSTPLAGLAD
jgi:hypothetical protein